MLLLLLLPLLAWGMAKHRWTNANSAHQHTDTHTLTHWQTCHQLAKRGGPANRIEEEQAADAPRVALLLLEIEINLDIGTLLTSINSNCW